jgi:hypothetical protein
VKSVPSRRIKDEALNPDLVKRLCRAIRRYPNIQAAADSCGVNPLTLQRWIKRGLYPNPDPLYAALAEAARRSLGLVKGKLFQALLEAATKGGAGGTGDPKWAAYLLEHMKEEGDLTWNDTIPSASDMPAVRTHLFQNPSPQLLKDIDAAGMKLVPKDVGEPPLALPAAEGELVDDE